MAYLDFDTILIDNQLFDETILLATFQFFSELGIRHFIFTYELDCDRMTIPAALSKLKHVQSRLKRCKTRGSRFYLALRPILTEGLVTHKQFKRLAFGQSSDCLFLSLPLFVGDEWVASDLNYLLYKQKLNPVFTSFERNLQTNSKELVNSISHISSAVYALDAMLLTSNEGFAIAQDLIKNGCRILPCVSKHLSEYAGIQKSYAHLMDHVPSVDYFNLCKCFHYTKSFILCSD